MLGIDQTRCHHRCDRPKDGMCGGNHQAGKHQNGKGRRHSREKLPAREQCDHRKEQASQIKARSEHHKRQREQHDAPGIDRDHHACRRLADMEGSGDIGQKTDGHELGGIKDKGGARQTNQWKPLPYRDSSLRHRFSSAMPLWYPSMPARLYAHASNEYPSLGTHHKKLRCPLRRDLS